MNLETFKNLFSSIFFFFILWSVLVFSLHAQTWQHLGLYGEWVEVIAIDSTNPNIIFAGTTSDASEGKAGKLFRSINGGITWDTLIHNITVFDIDFHPKDHNTLFVCGGTNGLTAPRIMKTTDGGTTWTRADSGMMFVDWVGPYVLEIDCNRPDTMYAGTVGEGGGSFYRSTNGGKVWKEIIVSRIFPNDITAIGIDPVHTECVYVGISGTPSLARSTNDGLTWSKSDSYTSNIREVIFKENGKMYIGAEMSYNYFNFGLFFSYDSFKTWQNLSFGITERTSITKIQSMGDTLYFIGNEKMLFRSIGDSTLETIDVLNNIINEVVVYNNNLYVGTRDGIMRRDIVTNVQRKNIFIPNKTILFQNYPNPFNSTTIINFQIGQNGITRIDIYDILGRKVFTLLNRFVESGYHTVTLNTETLSRALSSGVYIYMLSQNGHILSQRTMTFLK